MAKGPNNGISRREFLEKSGTAGVGTAAWVQAETGRRWDHTADFVTIGAGVSGLAAAVTAREHGASVILVDENSDIGGHGMVSGGLVHLGGGHRWQRVGEVEDSAEKVFQDWIRPDHPLARYNDRDLVRAFADENASTFEWLVENGVDFQEGMVGPQMASTVPRQVRTVQWPNKNEIYTSVPTRRGSGLVRALEAAARKKGARFLLRHRMTDIVRESQFSGRVLGITVTHEGRPLNIRANKGVLVATGGHSNNVSFRRIFDPRLTEEYNVAGDPYSRKSGDGEIAAMAIGASLWGTASQTNEAERCLRKAVHIGCKYGYASLHWPADSPIFDRVGASGLTGVDWANLILVTEVGERFYDETAADYDFIAAAMAYRGDPSKLNGGGPIWAIFDHEAVERQGWDPTPPNVDLDGYFFRADTVGELAARIVNPFQSRPMPAATLQETVARYNAFVDAGEDSDFGKPAPFYKVQTPPFYAAWSTPLIHDSYTGLRTNASAQVMDLQGQVIPGLYCAGECQGGFNQHGLARSIVFGRIAGRHVAMNGGEA
ncbi:MAG TPA: FAD-dependent oxidoreductase [Vicinamibacteria bacterium]|nr:FAD-dependent oxidoreductase [Vicinamibacteria bacterium]